MVFGISVNVVIMVKMFERVDIKVGFQCNNKCQFCIQGDKRYFFPDRTDEEVRGFLDQGREENKQQVVFTGGEPTFRPKLLLEWVSYARKIGYESIQIQTNGRMFSYLDYCKKIIEAGATEFSPAVHGSTAEIHDALTGAKGSFDQVTQGIKNLKSLKQFVITNSVITKINYRDLPNLARMLVGFEVDQFQFAFLHINTLIAGDENKILQIVPRVSEAIPYIKQGLDVGIKAGVRCMVEATPYCQMSGYEDYISEKIMPEAHVFDAELDIKKYSNYRKNLGKVKGPECKSCKMDSVCEGPWREYPEIFGWEEFRPIKN